MQKEICKEGVRKLKKGISVMERDSFMTERNAENSWSPRKYSENVLLWA